MQTALGRHANVCATLSEGLVLALALASPEALACALVGYAHWQHANESAQAATETLALLCDRADLERAELRLVAAQQRIKPHLPISPAPPAATLAEAVQAAQARLAAWAGSSTIRG